MKYICKICGQEVDVNEGESCPICGAFFSDLEPLEAKKTTWTCKVCGYQVTAESLPEDYVCPLCGVGKDEFTKE